MKIGAKAEYDPLKKVLMYRPGKEVAVVNETNKAGYLYREPVDWRKFRSQHDAFVSLLSREGVEVLLANDFLEESQTRNLPNLTFSRDICTVTERGAILCSMAHAARRREPEVYDAALGSLGIPVFHRMVGTLEGGDFVYLSNDILLLGWGPRTTLSGAKEVAERLRSGIVEEVVAVRLPDFRVHLDGGMMVVSPDTALVHLPSFTLPAIVLRNEREEETTLLDYLRARGTKLLEVPDEESRTFGSNVVCLGGDKLVSYDWNVETISRLEGEGFDVIPLDGSELAKAGGGPHCMTCPLLRE